MRPSFCLIWARIVALSVVAIFFVTSTAHAVPGKLDRPAVVTAKGASSVLLAVTSASTRLVAVGERGIILLSDDNGVTWRQVKVPASVTLTAVHFATNRKGWAVGHSGIVLHSEDRGENWTKQLDGKQAARLVLDAAQAKVRSGKGDAVKLKQQLAVAQQLVDDGADKPFFDIYFENENTGYIVGAYNLIFRTEDGGRSWKPWQDHVDNPRGLHLYGIRPAGRELYIAGEQGTILRSKDGGKTFVSLKSPYPGTYFGLLKTKDGHILVHGLRGNVFMSVDHGTTWQKIDIGVSLTVTGGTVLIDGTLVLVSQAGEVLLSRDKGRSFQKIPNIDPSPISGVAQSTDDNLVLVGVRGVTRIPIPTAFKTQSPTNKGGGK